MMTNRWNVCGFLCVALVCALGTAVLGADRIQAFCIDFNWGPGGPNGFAGPGHWADADPAQHVAWYEGLGANVIQTFAVSCNGYAWYKGGIVPPQPGLKHDFLTDTVRIGHEKHMRVMGYFCVGANTRWGADRPELSYGTPSAPHIPFTSEYLDFLANSISDALTKTGMDGFMIDWAWNPRDPQTKAIRWLPCEKKMFEELLGKPFPGPEKLSSEDVLAYEQKAIDRCWERIHDAAKQANPNCVIWLSCHSLADPTVAGSRLFREVDWLMNEAPDPRSLEKARAAAGPHTTLVQCLVGWGDQHDARRVLSDPAHRDLAVYGFSAPGDNSLPRPITDFAAKPINAFTGNDRNIAVLCRWFHQKPLDD